MLLSTSGSRARTWRFLRLALLAVGGLLIGHDVVYAVRFGVGDRLAAGMAASGHGYWSLFTLVATVALLALAIRAVLRLGRLAGAVRTLGPSWASRPAGGERRAAYLAELAGLWPPLFALVVAGFAVQENLEQLIVTGHAAGLEVLAGPSGLTLPVLAAVTALLAALGALVRWRSAILEGRLLAVRPDRRWTPPIASVPPHAWTLASAAIATRWTLLRRDDGRAPPLAVSAR